MRSRADGVWPEPADRPGDAIREVLRHLFAHRPWRGRGFAVAYWYARSLKPNPAVERCRDTSMLLA